eukprot:314973_1
MGGCCSNKENENVNAEIKASEPAKEEQSELIIKDENKTNEKTADTEHKYPAPPNGYNGSHSANLQGWTYDVCVDQCELYLQKLSTDRNVKIDTMRDGRLRMCMVVMKEYGNTDKVEFMVNKIHDAIYCRLMDENMSEIDLYNVGIILESIACLQITKLEDEIPKILAKDLDFTNIWKTQGIGLRAYGTNNLMLFLSRNRKKELRDMMERGMNTLQNIMILPMDKSLWKRCASIIAGLARTMKQKEFDILTMISGNIMDQLAKDTIAIFKKCKDNNDKDLSAMSDEMKPFTNFSRQDDKNAHPFPEVIYNRAVFKGEDWAEENFACEGNPMVDLTKWKQFIDENEIDKKEWAGTHEAFGMQLSDMWSITSGDDQKELEDKLKNGDLVIGRDFGSNYLGYLLALSHKINPMFQNKIQKLFGEKHKEAPVKKENRCNNKLRGKYANKPIPKAGELTDTIRCLVVFDNFKDLLDGYEVLKDNFSVSRVKNGFILDEKDVSFGYRDALINVVFDAGFCKIVCEVQFTTDLFFQLRGKLHKYYTFHRCEELTEMLTPCNKYVDKLVSTIEEQRKKNEQDEQKEDK